MRKNMLKEKIRNGESAIGTFVKLTDPAVPELLALAGFDFFVLDTEHVAVDREQLTNIVRAADAAGITPIVRVRENQQVEILQNLDLGYAGVQVPNVDTPEQARNLVSYVKYTPLGVRGLSPSVRACDYGTCGVQEYWHPGQRGAVYHGGGCRDRRGTDRHEGLGWTILLPQKLCRRLLKIRQNEKDRLR